MAAQGAAHRAAACEVCACAEPYTPPLAQAVGRRRAKSYAPAAARCYSTRRCARACALHAPAVARARGTRGGRRVLTASVRCSQGASNVRCALVRAASVRAAAREHALPCGAPLTRAWRFACRSAIASRRCRLPVRRRRGARTRRDAPLTRACAACAGTEMAQLECGGCRTLLMYIRGASSVQCSVCNTVNLAMQGAHTRGLARCGARQR